MLVGFLLLLLVGTLVALVFATNALWQTLRTGLPFVVTPNWVIEWMVEHLELSSNDIVYELGCGDARVISTLARRFPDAHFVGIEIQWWPYLLARWKTRSQPNINIIRDDIYKQNISTATIVYGFYITRFVEQLSSKLRAELAAGVRIFSFGFSLPGWQHIQQISPPGKLKGSPLLVYTV